MLNLKLLAISPAWQPDHWHGGRTISPPMCLPVLASLTPLDVEIHLVDENVEPVDLNEPADLVAISCLTASAPRGYQIADSFRARGTPVVIGGIHASVLPEEAAEHADAVVIGEAENQWPQVFADFAAGRPRRFYRTPHRPELKDLPLPRRDLLRTDRYLTVNIVQTARGCPNGCSFCSVSSTFGRRYRFRPVAEVVEEVRSLPSGHVAFADDNIVAKPRRAKELFEALVPLNLQWVSQGDLSATKDEELLSLMARSGCIAIFVGLDSLSEESLIAANKRPNTKMDYEKAVRACNRHGIDVVGSFVFGFDPDEPDVFQKTEAFAERLKLSAAHFTVLTPFPGTSLYEQLKEEGRITSTDWSRYSMGHVVYQPRKMTAEQLRLGRLYAYSRFYSLPSILRRTLLPPCGRRRWFLRVAVNLSYRRMHLGGRIQNRIPGEWVDARHA